MKQPSAHHIDVLGASSAAWRQPTRRATRKRWRGNRWSASSSTGWTWIVPVGRGKGKPPYVDVFAAGSWSWRTRLAGTSEAQRPWQPSESCGQLMMTVRCLVMKRTTKSVTTRCGSQCRSAAPEGACGRVRTCRHCCRKQRRGKV